MGNQSAKVSIKSGKYIEDVPTKSRTNWTAGVASPPGRPVIELSSRIATKEEDSVTDEINLSWNVPEDDGGYPITGYRVEMLDIQSGKWIEITFIEGYEPKCTLSNILYGIMYRFRVVALNDAGPSEPGEPSEPIVIDVPGVQIAPYFVQMLSDTIALEHEKIEFRVRVLGTPKPSVQWYKDDVEIFACERIEMKEEDEGGAVVLKESRLSDSGVIKCVASNILGRCTSTASFTIEAAPRFEVPESYVDGLIFRHEEVIRLRVPMIAKPTPKVVWFFEDEPITPGSDLMIETTDAFTSLRIEGAKRWHCGEFRVYAENEYGEDACSILVTVTSPPSPPGKPVIIDISETRCTLRWESSEDDGGADVKHYIVEYFRDVWEVWLKAKTTKETQVTIDDLIPGSRYKFRIKAENSYGISEPGDESDAFDVGGASADSRQFNILTEDSEMPSAPRPKRWSDIYAQSAENWTSPPPPEISIEATPEPPPTRKRPADMAKAKEMWPSDEHEDDILDRFLKVKKFSENQMPSYESDGIPSIAGIDDDEDGTSYSSRARNARRLYSELQQFSNDTNHPDLESISGDEEILSQNRSKEDLRRARELYEELRQMSSDTGGSIENLMEGISTSNESVASIIPANKRQELIKFEMTLKEMIEEARQLAESNEDLRRKSPSVQSIAESFVSVIEREPPPTAKIVIEPSTPSTQIPPPTFAPADHLEIPVRPERKNSPSRSPVPRRPHSVSPIRSGEDFTPSPSGTLSRRRNSEKPRANNDPLVGADRYEEIIKASDVRRSSSQLNLPKSIQGSMNNIFQPNATMAMREETKAQAMNKIESGGTGSRPGSSLSINRPGSALNNNNNLTKLAGSNTALNKSGSNTGINKSGASSQSNLFLGLETPRIIDVKLPSPKPVLVRKQAAPSEPSLNQSKTGHRPIEPTFDPVRHEELVQQEMNRLPNRQPNFADSSYPDWFMISMAYSMVFIFILLLSNVIPNGKLYIHFVAFFSMILYFLMDDDRNSSTDILESVMEGFVVKQK